MPDPSLADLLKRFYSSADLANDTVPSVEGELNPAGDNAAVLQSVIDAMVSLGLVTDDTTAPA